MVYVIFGVVASKSVTCMTEVSRARMVSLERMAAVRRYSPGET